MIKLLVVALSAGAVITDIQTGPSANRIDLIVMGDGYQATEQGTFGTHATNFYSDMFADPLFGRYEQFFNLHRIPTTSIDSGADDEFGIGNPVVSTALTA